MLLKTTVSSSKRFENSPASVKRKILFITTAKMSFPAVSRSIALLLLPANSMFPCKCNSQEHAAVRSQELKSVASGIAKEA